MGRLRLVWMFCYNLCFVAVFCLLYGGYWCWRCRRSPRMTNWCGRTFCVMGVLSRFSFWLRLLLLPGLLSLLAHVFRLIVASLAIVFRVYFSRLSLRWYCPPSFSFLVRGFFCLLPTVGSSRLVRLLRCWLWVWAGVLVVGSDNFLLPAHSRAVFALGVHCLRMFVARRCLVVVGIHLPASYEHP